MSDPTWAPARRLAGNYDDDDGQVIGSYVTTEASPPDPFPAASTPIPAPSPAPKRPTRLLSGTFILDPANPAPQPVVTQDVDRESLTVRVLSDNPTDYVLLGEDANRVSSPTSAHRLNSGGSQGFDAHTGALWVALPPQNIAAIDGGSTAGWTFPGGGSVALVPAPWDASRNAIQVTAAAAGTLSLKSPPLTSYYGRSGTNVTVRVKVVTNLFTAVTATLVSSTSNSLSGPQGSGIAPASAGYRELVLPGTIFRDANGTMCVYVNVTAAAAGDTLTVGDIMVTDRAIQGPTVISWVSVTA